jgi:hypothetical protein
MVQPCLSQEQQITATRAAQVAYGQPAPTLAQQTVASVLSPSLDRKTGVPDFCAFECFSQLLSTIRFEENILDFQCLVRVLGLDPFENPWPTPFAMLAYERNASVGDCPLAPDLLTHAANCGLDTDTDEKIDKPARNLFDTFSAIR